MLILRLPTASDDLNDPGTERLVPLDDPPPVEPPEPEQLLGVIRQEKVDIGPTYWMALPLTGPST